MAQFDDLPKDADKVPCIAVSLTVIKHFVRNKDLVAFDGVGFFMYHGVKVYENGHRNMPEVLKKVAE